MTNQITSYYDSMSVRIKVYRLGLGVVNTSVDRGHLSETDSFGGLGDFSLKRRDNIVCGGGQGSGEQSVKPLCANYLGYL